MDRVLRSGRAGLTGRGWQLWTRSVCRGRERWRMQEAVWHGLRLTRVRVWTPIPLGAWEPGYPTGRLFSSFSSYHLGTEVLTHVHSLWGLKLRVYCQTCALRHLSHAWCAPSWCASAWGRVLACTALFLAWNAVHACMHAAFKWQHCLPSYTRAVTAPWGRREPEGAWEGVRDSFLWAEWGGQLSVSWASLFYVTSGLPTFVILASST